VDDPVPLIKNAKLSLSLVVNVMDPKQWFVPFLVAIFRLPGQISWFVGVSGSGLQHCLAVVSEFWCDLQNLRKISLALALFNGSAALLVVLHSVLFIYPVGWHFFVLLNIT
jgi:hypothetical protein